MNHRLVGAVILGCLAIIFIPIVLDGDGITSPNLINDVPPTTPSIPPVPAIEAVRPIIIADTEQINLSPRVESEAESEAELRDGMPAYQLNSQGLPQAWNIRLASFGEQENAVILVSRLLEAGYRAFSRVYESPQGLLTAVFVGPVLSQSQAEKLQAELAQDFSLDGIVVSAALVEMTE